MYGKSKPICPPSDAQASEKLAHFVYEYLVFSGAEKAAQTFLQEIGWEKNILPNEAPGFLFSWWSVFWDLYCAAPERRDDFKHSNEARAFYEFGFVNPGFQSCVPQPSGLQCGPSRGGLHPSSQATHGLIGSNGQQINMINNNSFYSGGGVVSQQQMHQQREAMLMQQQQQQQAMASRQHIYGGPSRLVGGQPVPPQPHGDNKMGMPMVMMSGGMNEGIAFNSMELQQQQTFLPGGGNIPNSGGNVFFRSIPSLPIVSTPSVTLRHQPTAPPYPRQCPPNLISRQQPPPPSQQQIMNGGPQQPSLNSSSSASSFSGSPNNNNGLPGPTEQQYNSLLQQQIFQQQQQQQQRGPICKLPPRSAGHLNGMMSQQWNSNTPPQQQQLQQFGKQLLNQPANARQNKFQPSQEQPTQQQGSNFPLVFESGDINNLGGGANQGGSNEMFDFYDNIDGGGYLIGGGGVEKLAGGGVLVSSADLEIRLPLLPPESSVASSVSSSLLVDDRPPMKSQICQLLSPSPAAFSCGRTVVGLGGQPKTSPLNQHPSNLNGGGDPSGDQNMGLIGLSSSELEMLEAMATAGDSPRNPASMHWSTTTSNMQQQPPSLGSQGNNSIYMINDDAEAVQNLVDSMQDGDQQFCIDKASLYLQD